MSKRLKGLKLGLRAKVLLVVLGTALLTSGLFAFGINAVLKERFDVYLDRSIEQRNERIVEVIEELYGYYGDWRAVAERLDSVAPTMNTVIRVRDTRGVLVLDSSSGYMHGWMMREGMMGRMWMRGRSWGQTPENTYSYPLEYRGERIGTAEITVIGVSGRLTEEDLEFKNTIQDVVTTASVTAGLLALVLSLIFAHRVTKPVLDMTKVAQELRAGRFSARARVGRQDELGTLARTINDMARRLEEVDRMRKKFTADVAHELRTPVTTIRSYIEGFQDGVLEPTPERLKELEEETIRLTDLITDLQSLTMVESGRLKPELTSFDLAAEIRGLVQRMTPLFAEKEIAFRWDLPERLVVQADRKLLLRAVGNLVNNALKYTDPGGEVTVQARFHGKEVEISVADTGIGIHEKDLPYVFDRFYRADPSRARSTGGSGIGLSLVKEIAEVHGGRVSVESAPGQGSVFTLVIPAKK
ncbi:MAG: HAMP domain-containing protein [Firmicutes bacterium]|nr:HAMP domain-containing protein [Bacillota bacterium]